MPTIDTEQADANQAARIQGVNLLFIERQGHRICEMEDARTKELLLSYDIAIGNYVTAFGSGTTTLIEAVKVAVSEKSVVV